MRMWLGVGLAVLLTVIWVVANVVMKVTSMAIHLLLLGAAVVLAVNIVGRIRQRLTNGPTSGRPS
jgi:hypothetical protein